MRHMRLQAWGRKLVGHIFAAVSPCSLPCAPASGHTTLLQPSGISSGLSAAVLIATNQGAVHCLRSSDGAALWQYSVGQGPIPAAPCCLLSMPGPAALQVCVASSKGVVSVLEVKAAADSEASQQVLQLEGAREEKGSGVKQAAFTVTQLCAAVMPGELRAPPQAGKVAGWLMTCVHLNQPSPISTCMQASCSHLLFLATRAGLST